MNMTLAELKTVAVELSGVATGALVQEIRQPSPTAVTLSLRSPGATSYLLIETRASRARVHLVSARSTTIDPPPAFASKLRKDLAGSRVLSVSMPWEDRVLVVDFERRGGRSSLVVELSGHHPNLFLTGADRRIVLGLRPANSHKRSLVGGARYEPPPAPTAGPAGTAASRLQSDVPPSPQLEEIYEAQASQQQEERTREVLASALKRRLKRVRKTCKKIDEDLARAEKCEVFLRHGELLKMNLHRVRKGMTEIVVEDTLYGGGECNIELQPRLGPAENLSALFKRYKKGSRAVPVIEARRKQVGREADRLGVLLDSLSAAQTVAEVEEVGRLVEESFPGLRPQPATPGGGRRARAVRSPFREFVSSTGRPLQVGKGGRDNHQLTFQVASPHDVWLHVRGFSGSHVVIPLARGQEPDTETLLDAAHLAVRFSKAPDRGFAEVMWTRRKHVRAVKKGRPGQVIVAQERNVSFDVDEARLQRLLASAGRSTGAL